MGAASCPLFDRRSAWLTAIIVGLVLCFQCGCVSTKYKLAKKNTPPVQPLNIAFPPSPPLEVALAALISYGGPGSWKRQALWDEYVVALENHSDRSLTIDSAVLTDSAGAIYTPGSDPWALEKRSKKLEKQYRDRGEAFIRVAGPGVVIVGVGAATASAAAGSTAFVSAGVVGAAMATIIVLPVYYATVLGINHHNKKAVMTEFNRRRLPLPLTLAPGEMRTGSLFYPMVRSPSSLTLHWSTDISVLPLDFLHELHVPAAPSEIASK